MKLPEPLVDRLLQTWPVARLGTVDASGRPHAVPIVFVWSEGTIWSPVDGKPKREGELARVRNLRGNPHATLLLDRYDADWTRLWWIRLDGTARVLSAEAPERDPQLREPVELLRAKYPQYRRTPMFRGLPTLLGIRIERRAGWCASDAVLEELRGS